MRKLIVLGLFALMYIGSLKAQSSLDSGLVAFWSFNDSTANDISGNGHNGILYGNPQTVIGVDGIGLKFDGIDDYFEIAQGLNFGNEFTICFWMKLDSSACVGGGQSLFMKGEQCPDGNPNYKGTAYWLAVGGQTNLCDTSSGCNYLWGGLIEPNGNFLDDRIKFSSASPIQVGNFYFICLSFNNLTKNISLYVDASLTTANHHYESGSGTSCIEIDSTEFSQIHQSNATFKGGVTESWCGFTHSFVDYFDGILDEIRVYDRALSSVEIDSLYNINVLSLDNKAKEFPSLFMLEQNFPNPFNPSTTIKYNLSKSSFVTLKIYDVNGKEVQKLVNQHQKSGEYSISWDASHLASGLYFYRFRAGNFVKTRKMTLIR